MRYHVCRVVRGIDGRLHREPGHYVVGRGEAMRFARQWAERVKGFDSGHIAIRSGSWNGPVVAEYRYGGRLPYGQVRLWVEER